MRQGLAKLLRLAFNLPFSGFLMEFIYLQLHYRIQGKCPLSDECINIHHKMEYYLGIKEMKYWYILQLGRGLKTCLSEKKNYQKTSLCDTIYMKMPQTGRFIERVD